MAQRLCQSLFASKALHLWISTPFYFGKDVEINALLFIKRQKCI
jgi:hypothetical protein